MTTDSQKLFKVIVAGGGVAGLTLAHALQRANIDHVVLTRGKEIAPDWGASIGMHSHGCRMLDQLGLLEEVEKLCVPMQGSFNRLPGGGLLSSSSFFNTIRQNNGYDFLTVERRAFLQVLYENLPDRSVIHMEKDVIDITETTHGVIVHLKDGTSEEGSIVVGCDGVYSQVRTLMWEHANKTRPGTITEAEKRSLKAVYTSLIGISPSAPTTGLGHSDMTCVQNSGFTFLSLSQPINTYFFAIAKLPHPQHWPSLPRWTALDAEKEAARFATCPVSESLQFQDLWKTKVRGGMVSLEEGIFKHWYFGRTVLAGDSAHKVTANFALGGNSAMESVVVLTNHLQRLVAKSVHPSTTEIEAAFEGYQKERRARVRVIGWLSALVTRLQAWDGWVMKGLMRWVLPVIGDAVLLWFLGKLSSEVPVLDFVPVKSRMGRMKWKNEAREGKEGTVKL